MTPEVKAVAVTAICPATGRRSSVRATSTPGMPVTTPDRTATCTTPAGPARAERSTPGRPAQARRGKRKGTIDRVYQYRDAAGKVVHETVRWKNPKGFSQRRPIGNGQYKWTLKGIRTFLYRLPELLAADPAATGLRGRGGEGCRPPGVARFRRHNKPDGRGEVEAPLLRSPARPPRRHRPRQRSGRPRPCPTSSSVAARQGRVGQDRGAARGARERRRERLPRCAPAPSINSAIWPPTPPSGRPRRPRRRPRGTRPPPARRPRALRARVSRKSCCAWRTPRPCSTIRPAGPSPRCRSTDTSKSTRSSRRDSGGG